LYKANKTTVQYPWFLHRKRASIMKKNSTLLLCCIFGLSVHTNSRACYSAQERAIVKSLSTDEKIGQLLMAAAVATPHEPTKPSEHTEDDIKHLIEQYHIGGIIYLERSTPEEQLSTTLRLQEFNSPHNKIPLWIGLDAELGPAMRLDNTVKFPFNLALGAIQEEGLIERLGYTIGKQLQSLGIPLIFAPVADTNTNSGNPVINRRSFGQDPERVASYAHAYSRGLEKAGIMACAKHFPGHGDTSVDSHLGLPVIKHDIQRMQSIELAPFQYLIDRGIPSVMVGHLLIPTYDTDAPATLSFAITTKLLKEQCGFNGLVITDGLDMRGITDMQEPGMIEVKALQAGADLLLIPSNADKAFAQIKQAVHDGSITQEQLDEHVLKIIHAKNRYKPTDTCSPDQIAAALNTSEVHELSRLLYQKAITIVHNDSTIPLTATTGPTTVITIGLDAHCPFVATLSSTHQITPCCLGQNPSEAEISQAYTSAGHAKTVIIGLAGLTYQPQTNYGIAPQTIELIKTLQKLQSPLILVLFGNPYALKLFNDLPVLVEAYEDHPYAQQAAAAVLLGAVAAEGKLPIEP
jgi:beta-glucosidase-like glycosyl hydrolase